MRTIQLALLCALSVAWATPAFAADDTVVSTARELAEQGLNAYDAGHYEQAAQMLLKAYRAVRVPTLARNAARALAKQGKLVAASELYMEAKRLEPNKLWHGQMQQQAQQDCEQERQALLPRIARLKVLLDGVAAHDTTVSVDGVAIPEALVGSEQFADPGKHHIVARRGTEVVEQDVELKEGEHQQVTLQFSAAAAPQTSQAGAVQAPIAVGTTTPSDRAASGSGNSQRTWGWIGVSVGAAGVVLGATTGIIALADRSYLRSHGCLDYVCVGHSELETKAKSYDTKRMLSSVGFIAGGVIAATGVTLLLSSPRRESKATVGLLVGPGSIAVRGGF